MKTGKKECASAGRETVVSYVSASGQQEDWLVNAFSTGSEGVSTGCFASMNFRREAGDDPENIRRNFELSGRAIGFDPEEIVCTHQTHTTHVKRVYREDAGRGYLRDTGWTDVDGLITDVPGLVLTTFYADCVPLYFWIRSTGDRPVSFRLERKRQTAWENGRSGACSRNSGPIRKIFTLRIGPEHLQGLLRGQRRGRTPGFRTVYLTGKGNGKYLLDLHEANRGIKAEAGIPLDHIAMPDSVLPVIRIFCFRTEKTGGKRGPARLSVYTACPDYGLKAALRH